MDWIIATFIVLYFIQKTILFIGLFQQNGYKINKYLINLKKHYFKTYSTYFEYIEILLLLLYSVYNKWYIGLCFLILSFTSFLYKKPLVIYPKITKRVVRLLIVIFMLIVIFFFFLRNHLLIFFLDIVFLPFIIIISSIINSPIERIIKCTYKKRAKNKLNKIKPLIIGITGSFGKTTTKNIINTLINNQYYTYCTPKSYNTPMGLCKAINEMNYGVDVFVSELGATSPGDILELVGFVDVNIGIITDIGPQHLESFKTIDNVLNTKLEILKSESINKIIINNDNIYLRGAIYPSKVEVIRIGINNEADYNACNIKLSNKGISFDLYYKRQFLFSVNSTLLGKHNIYNLLCGIAMAKELNIKDNILLENISNIKQVDNRLSITNIGNIQILNDAFNSNIVGFKNAVEVLKFSKTNKILITPGIVDVGKTLKDINLDIGEELIKDIDFIYLIENEAALYIKECFDKNNFINYEVCLSFKEAYNKAINKYQYSTILIENDLPDNYLRR